MTVRSHANPQPEFAPANRRVEEDFLRFRDGSDTQALARVFDALAPDLLLVAAHLGRDAAAAEDLLQATFVAAIERRHTYQSDRALRPWLIGILAIQHRRHRRSDARVPDPKRVGRQAVAGPRDAAEAAEFTQAMEYALAGLPRHYRQPLSLRLLHGLSVAEIAHSSGCSPATVKTRLQRGLEHLRRALPAGLASSLAVALLPDRGLAAVREAILVRARDVAVSVAVVVPSVFAGVLLVKYVSLAALVVALAATGWWAYSSPASLAAPVSDASSSPSGGEAAVPERDPILKHNEARDDQPAGNVAPPDRIPVVSAATALHVKFVWSDGGAPVANHRVVVKCDGDPPVKAEVMTTDVDGRIVIDRAAPGNYRFVRQGWQREVEALLGQVVEATFQLDGFIEVAGVVRDGHGQPVGGAAVWFGHNTERQFLTTTAPNGTFATRLFGGGNIWVEALGFVASTARPIAATKGAKHTVEVILDVAGQWLEGQVVSANGQPVAGARLAIEIDSTQGAILGAAGGRQFARPPLLLTTGDDGRFQTRCAASGARRLIARAKGHGPVIVELALPAQQLVMVRLAKPASVSGTLRDARGAALAAGNVDLQWGTPFDGIGMIYNEFLMWRSPVDSQGQYQLADLPAGNVRLVVASGDLPRVEHGLALKAGEHVTWDPQLQSGIELRGRLVDVDEKPLEGWRVAAQARAKGRRFDHATTDVDGRFRFDSLPDVEHNLRARPPLLLGDAAKLVWGKVMSVRPGGEPVTLRIAHRLRDGGFLKGRLLGPDGRGVSGGSVMLDGFAFGRQSLKMHAEDGAFRVGPFPPGSYRITVGGGSGFMNAGRHMLPAAGEVDLGELRIAVTSQIAVFLDHPNGTEVRANLAVNAKNHGGGSFTFSRRADGAYVSGPLRPGPHVLTVRGETIAPTKAEVEVLVGRVAELRVPIVDAVKVTMQIDSAVNDTGSLEYVTFKVFDAAGKQVYVQIATLSPDAKRVMKRQGFAPGQYTLRAESVMRKLVGSETFFVPAGGEPMTVSVTMTAK